MTLHVFVIPAGTFAKGIITINLLILYSDGTAGEQLALDAHRHYFRCGCCIKSFVHFFIWFLSYIISYIFKLTSHE